MDLSKLILITPFALGLWSALSHPGSWHSLPPQAKLIPTKSETGFVENLLVISFFC
jgi:hypothetical protein